MVKFANNLFILLINTIHKMAWEAEPVKHFLEIAHIEHDGEEFTRSKEYRPGEQETNISVVMMKEDAELRVKPYTLEHLKNLVMEHPVGAGNELFVGIRDGKSIEYVGKIWTPRDFSGKRINQYFFKDDKPAGCNLGFYSGPTWPTNHPPLFDERLKTYFDALREMRPGIAESLERCMEHLTKPGPEYTGVSDGSITVKL